MGTSPGPLSEDAPISFSSRHESGDALPPWDFSLAALVLVRSRHLRLAVVWVLEFGYQHPRQGERVTLARVVLGMVRGHHWPSRRHLFCPASAAKRSQQMRVTRAESRA